LVIVFPLPLLFMAPLGKQSKSKRGNAPGNTSYHSSAMNTKWWKWIFYLWSTVNWYLLLEIVLSYMYTFSIWLSLLPVFQVTTPV